MENPPFPTFMVIGAQKCGTTWLAQMTRQHPEVGVGPVKEMHFFNKTENYHRGFDWYRRQFDVSPKTRAIGEFTPNYFWTSDEARERGESSRTKNIPALVHGVLPDLKLIVCLRNPVDRAVSAYYHHIRQGRVTHKQRLAMVADRFGITSMGYYDVHLQNWLTYYPADRVLTLIYEDDILDENKLATLKRVFRHIGVDDTFVPDDVFARHNTANLHFDIRIHHLSLPDVLRAVIRRATPDFIRHLPIWKIPVTHEERAELREVFRPHNRALGKLLDRELPW